MDFLHNFPFFSIIVSMFSGIVCSVLPRKAARAVTISALVINLCLSAGTLVFTISTGDSTVYMMGHFPAPWGNEIRFGMLEALMAASFVLIMLLSLLGGMHTLETELEHTKENLFYVLVNMLLSSLLALIYTNDLFTAYVFVEINTISACGLIMIRKTRHNLISAVRYMIMSLVGSGLLLLGICMIYGLTGHLLMSNIKETIAEIMETHSYTFPMEVTIGLVAVGLAIKSALVPFHAWVPGAYGHSITAAASVLSGLVSKGYIFLLIKLIYRVFGFDVIAGSRILNILFVFGIAAMIVGSVDAIRERDVRRMTANSSIAQIGYIYVGIGMGSAAGMAAALFHILTHAISKPLLFLSADGLTFVSGGSKKFNDLTGSAHRNILAGIGFTAGSLSMIGFPLTAGFISKYLFAESCIGNGYRMALTIAALAISTVLNAAYFMRTVIRIWMPENEHVQQLKAENPDGFVKYKNSFFVVAAVGAFILLNLILGMVSQPVTDIIEKGLTLFS